MLTAADRTIKPLSWPQLKDSGVWRATLRPITVHEFAGIKSYYLDTREVTNLMSALMWPLASLKVSWQLEGH